MAGICVTAAYKVNGIQIDDSDQIQSQILVSSSLSLGQCNYNVMIQNFKEMKCCRIKHAYFSANQNW